MSDSGGIKRNKTDLVKWALAAMSAVIVLLVIGYGLIQQSANSQSAADRSADYSKNAAAQINQACAVVTKLEKPVCLEKAKTEYRLQSRDKQREYDDLAAQQTSALWTSIMGIAALVGMGLSAIGVILVYITFRAAKDGNDIATLSAQSDRAWFTFKSLQCSLNDVPLDDKGTRASLVHFVVNWENTGQSPAVRAGCWTDYRKTIEPIEKLQTMEIEQFLEHGDEASTAVVGPQNCIVTNSRTLSEKDSADFMAGQIGVIVYSKVSYATIYNADERKASEAVLFICILGQMQDADGKLVPQLHVMPVGKQNTAN